MYKMPVRPTKSTNGATKFPKLDLPFNGEICLGNMTQWRIKLTEDYNGDLIFELPCKNYRDVILRYYTVTPEFLSKQLTQSDRANLADLLNSQINREYKLPILGYYYENLLYQEVKDEI
jgi:hypothetical protein